jgi:hypothetical protein
MDECIFCKIANKEIPAKVVYEDDRILAFDDINPQAPVHVLLIPKEHFTSLNDIPQEKKDLLGQILAKAGRSGKGSQGKRIPDRPQHSQGFGPRRLAHPLSRSRWKTHDLAPRLIFVLAF